MSLFAKYGGQQPFNTSHTLFINLIENNFGDTFGDIYKAYNMYFYLIQYVRCYVLFLLSHHLNQKRYRKHFFKSLSGFTPGLLSPETDALKFHALIAEPRHQNYHHGQ
ncbi:Uncharacterised protein [Klebsiella pneumoniae]|uniref:Uncharacterized protein n=1 Tax=Klebsiella pneumoniae TaxID=573 RepID=A0A377ZHW8_KLEPN|nr:Uncharacterised protein [Klebsiella pneumoniae]